MSVKILFRAAFFIKFPSSNIPIPDKKYAYPKFSNVLYACILSYSPLVRSKNVFNLPLNTDFNVL